MMRRRRIELLGSGVILSLAAWVVVRHVDSIRHARKIPAAKAALAGHSTNRSAIGARIRADLIAPDGSTRSTHRTVGNNSSFGGNCVVESIGLLDSTSVEARTVDRPVSGTTRIYRDIAADESIEIIEGSDAIRVLDPRPSAERVTR